MPGSTGMYRENIAIRGSDQYRAITWD